MELHTELQVQISGCSGRLKSSLVGKEEGRFLIIKMPLVAEPETFFAPGRELVVRYVFQGNVFGFRSTVLLPLPGNFNVVFIAFPTRIENVNLRTHKRFTCYLPATMQVQARVQDRQLIFQGAIVDISKGGCKMAIGLQELEWVKEPLKIQSEVTILFQLPGVEEELTLRGEVKSMVRNESTLHLGIQFMTLEGRSQKEIHKFIAANDH